MCLRHSLKLCSLSRSLFCQNTVTPHRKLKNPRNKKQRTDLWLTRKKHVITKCTDVSLLSNLILCIEFLLSQWPEASFYKLVLRKSCGSVSIEGWIRIKHKRKLWSTLSKPNSLSIKLLNIFQKVTPIIISSLLATHFGMQFTRQQSKHGVTYGWKIPDLWGKWSIAALCWAFLSY